MRLGQSLVSSRNRELELFNPSLVEIDLRVVNYRWYICTVEYTCFYCRTWSAFVETPEPSQNY